ncbi:PREDICTED: proline-rich protein 2-like, partial [Bison bison bison]|uniref:Proline-rich protein 2-like n=1 Tax=Bison bison bison TaxID=43346 RepID=A0A6P3GQ31_BISBB
MAPGAPSTPIKAWGCPEKPHFPGGGRLCQLQLHAPGSSPEAPRPGVPPLRLFCPPGPPPRLRHTRTDTASGVHPRLWGAPVCLLGGMSWPQPGPDSVHSLQPQTLRPPPPVGSCGHSELLGSGWQQADAAHPPGGHRRTVLALPGQTLPQPAPPALVHFEAALCARLHSGIDGCPLGTVAATGPRQPAHPHKPQHAGPPSSDSPTGLGWARLPSASTPTFLPSAVVLGRHLRLCHQPPTSAFLRAPESGSCTQGRPAALSTLMCTFPGPEPLVGGPVATGTAHCAENPALGLSVLGGPT